MQDVDHARKADAVNGNRMSGRWSFCFFFLPYFSFFFSFNDLHDDRNHASNPGSGVNGSMACHFLQSLLYIFFISLLCRYALVFLSLFSTITTYLTLPADCCYSRDFHDERRARLSIAIIHCPLISFVSLEMTFTVRLLPSSFRRLRIVGVFRIPSHLARYQIRPPKNLTDPTH
ncbi:hypothetical protein ASPBRDRAFT_355907 [Aspergillus brasiliensis CBS 101740]|uniref:Uncharacterized protein n=1 Tax=Aspergillus brasiliensis (strain CBS 101740 / IMI 381727 / IBT 21946) TaxID=767769 RepID=A0A1L9U5K2_ASPBC|nr:hypothetical protein ASPBRDRAFT_355907 [Aspergillus brasiliensis CBS 101740]